MKRIILTILIMLSMVGLAMAEPARIGCQSLFSGTIAASGTTTTYPNKLEKNEGFFSVQPVFTGTGVLKIDYQVSNDGSTWSPAVQIVASATSGTVYPYPASGVNIFSGWQRLVLTETGTSAAVVVTKVSRCIQ